jgi:hypothetical protein
MERRGNHLRITPTVCYTLVQVMTDLKQTSSPLFKFLSAAYLSIWEATIIVLPLQVGWDRLAPINLNNPNPFLTGGAIFIYCYIGFLTIQRYRRSQFPTQKDTSAYRAMALVMLGVIILYSAIWLIAKHSQVVNDWPQLARVWGVAVVIYAPIKVAVGPPEE